MSEEKKVEDFSAEEALNFIFNEATASAPQGVHAYAYIKQMDVLKAKVEEAIAPS